MVLLVRYNINENHRCSVTKKTFVLKIKTISLDMDRACHEHTGVYIDLHMCLPVQYILFHIHTHTHTHTLYIII